MAMSKSKDIDVLSSKAQCFTPKMNVENDPKRQALLRK